MNGMNKDSLNVMQMKNMEMKDIITVKEYEQI